mgnify:CR=1 FL=1
MTTTATDPGTYRTTYTALWAIGAIAFAGLIVAGLPFVGALAFFFAAAAAIGISTQSKTVMFDERDEAVFGDAGRWTIAIVGIASGVVFPTMTALRALGRVEWPLWFTHLAYFVAGLFAVWLAMVLLARYQR